MCLCDTREQTSLVLAHQAGTFMIEYSIFGRTIPLIVIPASMSMSIHKSRGKCITVPSCCSVLRISDKLRFTLFMIQLKYSPWQWPLPISSWLVVTLTNLGVPPGKGLRFSCYALHFIFSVLSDLFLTISCFLWIDRSLSDGGRWASSNIIVAHSLISQINMPHTHTHTFTQMSCDSTRVFGETSVGSMMYDQPSTWDKYFYRTPERSNQSGTSTPQNLLESGFSQITNTCLHNLKSLLWKTMYIR